MKIMTMLGLTGISAVLCGSVWAQSPMSCELAGALTGTGAKKVYAAKANLRCPADANAIEIEKISVDAKVVESPQRQTKVTMNWDYVFRRKPSQGAVTFDVYGGAALLKSCPTEILNKDFSDTASSSDSAECDLPADSYGKIDRIVFRIKGSYR
ncbi:MAG: hypothetical protein HYX43_18800 [Burkholderiales bacterium]|nr:hypothetical protein [Burkholderiales bacterium]